MSCRELIAMASAHQELQLDAPVRICPKCHKKSPVDVHVDGKKGIIYLSCSKCDRVIQRINVKGTNGLPVKPGR